MKSDEQRLAEALEEASAMIERGITQMLDAHLDRLAAIDRATASFDLAEVRRLVEEEVQRTQRAKEQMRQPQESQREVR